MKHRLLLIIIASFIIAGCTFPNVVAPYKLDIPQGNVITEDIVAKLKLGMTRSQVRFVLGSPLLVDPFHNNRWDYVYTDAQNSKIVQKKTFTVFFEQDKLTHFEGDVLPATRKIEILNASTPANKKD